MRAIAAMIRHRPVTALFLVVYLITWGVGTALLGRANEIFSPLFVGGAFIAALIVVAIADGRAGFADLWRRARIWRVAPRWYLVVLLVPVALIAAALTINVYGGGTAPDWSKTPSLATIGIYFLVFMILPIAAPLAEEVAWRGVALPRMLKLGSPLEASLVLGVVWSLWHLPGIIAHPELRPPAPFLLTGPALSILMAWVFINTRQSLFIAILFHAWYDLVLLAVVALIALPDVERILWALCGLHWLLAIAIVASDRRRWLARPDAETNFVTAETAKAIPQ